MEDYLIDFGDGLKLNVKSIVNYEYVDQDYDVDPTRTVGARLFRNRVAMIPEVTVTLVPMTASEAAPILQVLSKDEFTVKFWHTTHMQYMTAEFYCGPSSRKVKLRKTLNQGLIYDEFTFKLTGIHIAR